MSDLKTKCLTLLDRVLRITHFAKTTDEVFAPRDSSEWMGSMRDSIEILDDIVAPANQESDWEVLR